MGEYYPAEIEIGGTIPAALLDEFLTHVRDSGASVSEYEGDRPEPTTPEELQDLLECDGHLSLKDTQAKYGQFEELEAFCVKHGIPFDRHSEAHYELDCENLYFRPGMEEPAWFYSNNKGDDLIDVSTIRDAVKAMASAILAGQGETDALTELMAALPAEVEPLPPLVIEQLQVA